VLPELYLHGLAQGDFELALLGDGAPWSAPSIARLKAGWQAEYELWKTRSVADLEVVYLWVDGVYVKAGLDRDKAAMLVVLAALRDGQKVILAVESGDRESTESWAARLRDLQRRGLGAPKLVLGDGHLGIWGALAAVYPRGQRATVLEPSRGLAEVGQALERDRERRVTFHQFPREHWKHLRTSNPIESPRCGCARPPPSGSRK